MKKDKIKKFLTVFSRATTIRQEQELRFTDLLFLLFLGLWLSEQIFWAWYWVFCPLLFPFILSFFSIYKEIRLREAMAKEVIEDQKDENGKFDWEKIANAEAEDAKNLLKKDK